MTVTNIEEGFKQKVVASVWEDRICSIPVSLFGRND